jgi:hypothetical protein
MAEEIAESEKAAQADAALGQALKGGFGAPGVDTTPAPPTPAPAPAPKKPAPAPKKPGR